MRTPLEYVSQGAARHGINLNDDVSRNDSGVNPLIGASAIVRRGHLRTGGEAVAVKMIRFAPLEKKGAVEVIAGCRVLLVAADHCDSAHRSGGMCMVQNSTQKCSPTDRHCYHI